MFCGSAWRWVGWIAGAGVLLTPERGRGQATAEAVLVQMAGQAGVIFAGQVLEVRHAEAKGWVEVRFRVEVPVRGVGRVGSMEYAMREWSGLWSGADRYGVGRRYLMLLLPKAASGLSGPVDGMDGAIPLIPAGGATSVDEGATTASKTVASVAEMGVDLRWIEARVERNMAGTSTEEAAARGLRVGGRALIDGMDVPSIAPGRSGIGVGKVWDGAIRPLGSAGASMKLGAVVALLQPGSELSHEAR